MATKPRIASMLAPMSLLGLLLGGCITLSVDSDDAGTMKVNLEVRQQGSGVRGGVVSCDLRMIDVSDGTVTANATGEAPAEKLADLSKALARKLREGMMVKGEPIAVVSLRNRGGGARGKTTADELGDKVSGALVDTGWFDVKERIDLRSVVDEKDLETAGIVKNENVKKKLADVKYVVIGGVTAADASK